MNAMNGAIEPGELTLDSPSASEIHLSLAYRHGDENDQLNFLAQDTEGHFFYAVAEMPVDGFMAGATYSCQIVLDQVN